MLTKKFSKREYELRAREIVARMQQETTPFKDNSEKAKKERIERAKKDRLWFFETYFPHYFNKPFGDFHREWNSLADVTDEPVFIAAPREHTKSTFFTLGVPVHDICAGKRHFILIISDTEDLAADFSQFIQLELEENERIKQDFGDLTNQGNWESKDFITKNGIRVKARGRGQRVRGLRNRQYRVDRIIIDDLENDKNVKNPRLIREGIDWLLEAVINTLAEGGSMTMIGTLLSKKSVLAQMIAMKDESPVAETHGRASVQETPRFISRLYKAMGDDGKPLWPGGWTKERLAQRKKLIGSIRFNKEYQNDPRDDEGMFREEWIRYYHPEEIAGRTLRKYTAIDPSMESGASSDYKAIITIGIDLDGIIYVLDAFIRRCSVDTMARVGYSRYEEYNPLIMSMEENALGEFANSPFLLVSRDKKYQLPLKGIKQTIAKEARIGRISPHVERGLIRFRKGQGDQDLLVEQLVYFPSSTVNDDGPDALEGAVDLAEKGSGVIEYQSTGVKRISSGREMTRFLTA
ncbi:MAG: phage terminase large subunit [Candidatus Brocadia sp.]|nr:phage terminase large subunit [Candidatus Brocadia sp.]